MPRKGYLEMRKRASITFFMSIVYLTLLVFAVGLIESYRLRANWATQNQANRLAIHNMMSNFDQQIAEEYGLFFYDSLTTNRTKTLNRTYQTVYGQKPTPDYYIDYLNQGPKQYLNLNRPVDYHYQLKKEEMTLSQMMSSRQEALLFTKMRLPYLFSEPLLEKLSLIEKAGHSHNWVERKNRLIRGLDNNEQTMRRLYRAFDGVNVSPNNGQVGFWADSYGLNHFGITDSTNEAKLEKRLAESDIPEEVATYFRQSQKSAGSIFRRQSAYRRQMTERLGELMSEPDFELSESATKEEKLERLEWRKMKKAEQQQFIEDYRQEHYQIIEDVETLRRLKVTYLTVEQDLAGVVKNNKRIVSELKGFRKELSSADINRSTKQALMTECLEIIRLYDDNGDYALEKNNNYVYLNQKMTKEKAQVMECLRELDDLLTISDELIANEMEKYKETNPWQYRMLKLKLGWYGIHFHPNQMVTESGLHYRQLGFIKRYQHLTFYYPLTYKGANKAPSTETKQSLNQQISELKQAWTPDRLAMHMPESESVDSNPVNNQEEAMDVPSTLREKENSTPEEDQSGEIKMTGIEGLSAKAKHLGEEILLHEYYLMVFSDFSLQSDQWVALSGYSKKVHSRKGEVEYILFGKDEATNRQIMIGSLIGIRTAMNSLHLATDADKRKIIIRLANAIAGWWSFGAGAVVLAVIIGALWALVEAIIDVLLLLQGERVAFYKTDRTWYTSLDGQLHALIEPMIKGAGRKIKEQYHEDIDEYEVEISQITNGLTEQASHQVKKELASYIEQQRSQVANYSNRLKNTVQQRISYLLDEDQMANTQQEGNEGADEIVLPEALEKQLRQLVEANRPDDDYLDYVEKTDLVNRLTDKVETAVMEEVTSKEAEINRQTKKRLNKLADAVKEKGDCALEQSEEIVLQQVREAIKSEDEDMEEFKDGIDLMMGYHDYLRIFLLTGGIVDSEGQWLRALDLIDWNQRQQSKSFRLLKTERQFKIESVTNYQPFFLALPSGASDLTFGIPVTDEGLYQQKVVTEGGYQSE